MKKKEVEAKQNTTVGNPINEGKYLIEVQQETEQEATVEIEQTEKEKQMYRGLKEKEKEFLHLLYYKYNQAETFEPIVFEFKEISKELGIDPMKKASEMRVLINSMAGLRTTFKYDAKGSFITFPIFKVFKFDIPTQTLSVKFNDDLLDYLYCDRDIKLIQKWSEYRKKKRTITTAEAQEFKPKHKGNYTITSHLEMTRLRSSYAMELYEKLSQFKNLEKSKLKNTKTYTMKELRELLVIPKSYKPFHIKKHVLELAKKQINEYTSIKIDYEIEGTGQRQSVKFTIENNEKNNPEIKEKSKEKQIENNSKDRNVEEIISNLAGAKTSAGITSTKAPEEKKEKQKVTQAQYEDLYAKHLEEYNIKHTKIVEMVFKNQYEIVEAEEKEVEVCDAGFSEIEETTETVTIKTSGEKKEGINIWNTDFDTDFGWLNYHVEGFPKAEDFENALFTYFCQLYSLETNSEEARATFEVIKQDKKEKGELEEDFLKVQRIKRLKMFKEAGIRWEEHEHPAINLIRANKAYRDQREEKK